MVVFHQKLGLLMDDAWQININDVDIEEEILPGNGTARSRSYDWDDEDEEEEEEEYFQNNTIRRN